MTASTQPPNILWLCTDQQGWDTLGTYGNPWVRTPNLDRLAEDGVVFEHCYAQSPVCTPSRASFLTGRYPRTNGCRQNGTDLAHDEVLVTRLLADDGYIGGLAGKLHLAACHPSISPDGEPRMDDGYSAFHWSHHPDADWASNEYSQWLAEHGTAYSKTPFDGSRFVQTGPAPERSQTAWCTEKAVDFIHERANDTQPWFFSVNYYDPHHAFDPPRAYLEPYLSLLADLQQPNYHEGELDRKPVFQRTDHQNAYNTPGLYPFVHMTAHDHALLRAAYWAMIDQIDASVGRLMDALQATGQHHNTIVIFMSDHGEMLGDHGIYLKGPYFYDPAVRVPLIVRWPERIAAGRRSEALVELADLAPTLLEASGHAPHVGMQGRSLLPLLLGDTPPDEHHADVYCEYLNAMPWHRDPAPHATMLRTRDHKIVAMHSTGDGELYDLHADPDETHNRWDDPAYASVRATLLGRLLDRVALSADPLPPRRAPW